MVGRGGVMGRRTVMGTLNHGYSHNSFSRTRARGRHVDATHAARASGDEHRQLIERRQRRARRRIGERKECRVKHGEAVHEIVKWIRMVLARKCTYVRNDAFHGNLKRIEQVKVSEGVDHHSCTAQIRHTDRIQIPHVHRCRTVAVETENGGAQ